MSEQCLFASSMNICLIYPRASYFLEGVCYQLRCARQAPDPACFLSPPESAVANRTEYVRIPLESAKRIDFYNNRDLAGLVAANLKDKEKCALHSGR